jgi:hypothetical protein
MKRLAIICTALLSLTAILGSTVSASGNGAPSGSHYNLNIIGVPEGAEANFADGWPDLTGSNRHTIFVSLDGVSKILLREGDFQVIDGNALDGSATFQLPDPIDPDEPCTDIFVDDVLVDTVCVTAYSVFARAPGNRGGDATMKTCATDPDTDEIVCSVQVLQVTQSSKFKNVTRYLLFVFWDTDGDGDADKLVPIFDEDLEGYYWEYDNNGLKLLQLRFYDCATSVHLAGNGTLDSSDCVLTGN